MKPNKVKSPRTTAIDAWVAELKVALTETAGEPVIRKIPYERSEMPAEMLWWRASGAPSVCIGIGKEDSGLLAADVADILSRTWGPGEITDESPDDTEGWDVWNLQLASGPNVRFYVSPEISSGPGRNLELLMDIELPIVIRFGHTQMPLRELAGLTPGSVIGFDRSVDDPVELLVNGHVVALGEAIMVKGSYGIRISEISSQKERLATSAFSVQEHTL